MNIELITSFSGKGLETYVPQFLESFKKWPSDVYLTAYYHDLSPFQLLPTIPNVEFRSLHDIPAHEEFYATYGNVNGIDGQHYNYRFDAAKFTHKVFAIADAIERRMESSEDYPIIWLDADTVTLENPQPLLATLNRDTFHWLDRTTMPYAETSFLFIPDTARWYITFMGLRQIFTSGEFLNHKEYHDGWILTRLMKAIPSSNFIVKNLTPEDYRGIDAFDNSILGRYMKHYKGNQKNNIPMYQAPMPAIQPPSGAAHKVKIQPQDCVPADDILGNIKANESRIDKWVKQCRRNSDEVFVLSAGPSLEASIPEIKEQIEASKEAGRNPKVMCVKHSHNLLIDNGIVPWGCVLLDPRPHTGLSTSGHKRSDLIANPHPQTKYFTATMVHPDVLTHLKNCGSNIIGWDAYTNAVAKHQLPTGRFYITGGTCSAMRVIGLMHTYGFRSFRLYGFDACVYTPVDLNEKDEKGRPRWLKTRLGDPNNGEEFISTGEWLALAQDFEQLMLDVKSGKLDLDISAHGGGIIPAMYKKLKVELPDYREVV